MEIRPSFVSSGGIPTTYEHEMDEKTGRVKLIITYPMNTDCGLYRCCILDRNSQRVDEISHLVYKVFNPPPHIPLEELDLTGDRKNRIVFDNYLSDITAEEGGNNIRLNCKISQLNAQSEIKWFRNNEEIPVEDCREKYRFTKSYNRLCLEILHPSLADAGAYECRVKNQYNELSSKCNVYVNERVERHRSKASPRRGTFLIILSVKRWKFIFLKTFEINSHLITLPHLTFNQSQLTFPQLYFHAISLSHHSSLSTNPHYIDVATTHTQT
jgi:hypothetical protein